MACFRKIHFRRMYWGGHEAERGDREARKKAAEDAGQEMAGAQMGIMVVERKDELEM